MSMDFLKSLYFEIASYLVPQKVKYRIEGQCRKCGECCRQIRSRELHNEKELKFMQFIFPHYKRFFITGTDNEGNLILSCKYLQDNGLCGVYDKRPGLCRNYPEKYISYYAEMPNGCGFKNIKKDFKDF